MNAWDAYVLQPHLNATVTELYTFADAKSVVSSISTNLIPSHRRAASQTPVTPVPCQDEKTQSLQNGLQFFARLRVPSPRLVHQRCALFNWWVARGFCSETRGCSASGTFGDAVGGNNWHNKFAKQTTQPADILSIHRSTSSGSHRSKVSAPQP